MIFAKSTKYNVGLTIYGDYQDFTSLHASIHKIIEEGNGFGAMGDFLLDFASEVRYAYEGGRETLNLEGEEVLNFSTSGYIGFNAIWTTFLPQIVMLRDAASFLTLNRNIQADLWRLEACAEDALLKANADIGLQCLKWLENGMRFSPNYIFEFINDTSYQYIYGHKTKRRILKLPTLLKQLSIYSQEYKDFSGQLEKYAQVKQCSVNSIYDGREWEDFKW